MKRENLIVAASICLVTIYTVTMFAPFFSPYSYAFQDRNFPYLPPTRLHLVDRTGHIHLRPFVYRSAECRGQVGCYEEDTQSRYPIILLPQAQTYAVVGTIGLHHHLFGVSLPAKIFLMGTDRFGRDVYSRVLFGGQISLLCGAIATIMALTIGTTLGVWAGFYEGWVDGAIMRLGEFFLVVPWLYLLLGLRAVLPLHIRPLVTILLFVAVIGAVGWARPARLIRGVVLGMKRDKHLLAARSFGASDFYIMRRHVLPAVRPVLVTQATLLMPQYILAETTLSFLGLGLGEPTPSWGTMLASLQEYHILVSKWWLFSPASIVMTLTVSYGVLSHSLRTTPANRLKAEKAK